MSVGLVDAGSRTDGEVDFMAPGKSAAAYSVRWSPGVDHRQISICLSAENLTDSRLMNALYVNVGKKLGVAP